MKLRQINSSDARYVGFFTQNTNILFCLSRFSHCTLFGTPKSLKSDTFKLNVMSIYNVKTYVKIVRLRVTK